MLTFSKSFTASFSFVYVCSVVSNSLRLYGLWPARFLCPWNFQGKITLEGVAISYSRGFFLT